MYLQLILILMVIAILPLYNSFQHLRAREIAVGSLFLIFALVCILSVAGILPYDDQKPILTFATFGNAFTALFSALKIQSLPKSQKIYLNGSIAGTNLFVAVILFVDLTNIRFFGISDDIIGVAIGALFAALALGLIYREHQRLKTKY